MFRVQLAGLYITLKAANKDAQMFKKRLKMQKKLVDWKVKQVKPTKERQRKQVPAEALQSDVSQ
jgi:hypothetical protein